MYLYVSFLSITMIIMVIHVINDKFYIINKFILYIFHMNVYVDSRTRYVIRMRFHVFFLLFLIS